MLELKNITKTYVTGSLSVQALKGIDLRFRESEFVSILGPSGCGKTTTLNIIGGLDQYTTGDLVINGTSTKLYKDRDWDSYRNHSCGFVFQSYNLIPHQTILANVELALSLSGVDRKERRQRAIEALDKVGLKEHILKRPSELSGGQMQRVAIARAIVNDPDIILADEPTGALDTKTSVQVMEILKEISQDRLVIMVTHNPELASQYSTRIINMLDGNIVGDSNPLSEEEIKEFEREDLVKTVNDMVSKKTSMSFLTSFGLSLNNLFTKKGRTLLTAIAGSIGIIGIALIYAVSNGMSDYIDTIQRDALSSYPLTITSESSDMTSMISAFMSANEEDEDSDAKIFEESQLMGQFFASIGTNDLGTLKKYLDENSKEVEKNVAQIDYIYSITPRIYTIDVTGKMIQVNPNTLFSSMGAYYLNTGMFQKLVGTDEMLEDTYDVLYGRLPESYDEVVFIATSKDSISDVVAYSLGMIDQTKLKELMKEVMNGNEVDYSREPQSWSYDDIMDLEFTLIHRTDMYRYNSDYNVWESMVDDETYMRELYDSSEKLKVVGIIMPKSTSMSGVGIGYKPELIEHIIERASNTQIVKSQILNKDIDVFSGKSFDVASEEEGATLDFQNMISIDTNMMQSAFGIDLSNIDISPVISKHFSNMAQTISSNMEPAYNMVSADFELLAKDLLNKFIEDNLDEGLVTVESVDVSKYVDEYLSSSDAKKITSNLVKDYSVTYDDIDTLFSSLLEDLLTSFLTEVEGKSEADAKGMVDGYIENYLASIYTTSTFSAMSMRLVILKTQGDLSKEVSAIVQESMGELYGAIKIDPAKLASAFKFNMTQDDLTRLITAMNSSTTRKTYDSNLRGLGYSSLNNPVSISFYFDDFDHKEEFLKFLNEYNDKMKAADKEDQVISYTDTTAILMTSVKKIVNSVSYVLIAFVAISLVVSSIMIGVITLISVQERTKEIGILRAIGASKKNVSSMFNAETVIIGFASGLIGVVVSMLLCIPINAVIYSLTKIASLKAKLPLNVAITLVIISIFLTLVAGIIPSRSAAKKDPVVALRTE